MTSSDRKAKVPERDTACYSRAIFDDSNSRQRNQENEADEMAVAPTDTPNLTSSHSLAIQLGSINDGKKHWGGNSSSSTDFFCLDVFGKATAVHRIGWRAGIHGQAQDTPRKQRKKYSPSAKGTWRCCFSFLFCSFLEITSLECTSPRDGLEHSNTRHTTDRAGFKRI